MRPAVAPDDIQKPTCHINMGSITTSPATHKASTAKDFTCQPAVKHNTDIAAIAAARNTDGSARVSTVNHANTKSVATSRARGRIRVSSGAAAAPTFRSLVAADLPGQPFDLSAFWPGVTTASVKVTRVPVARAITFAAAFAGSYVKAAVAATASTAFDVQLNGASIGTITFAAAGTVATLATAGGATFTTAAGDLLAIIAPDTPDATLADIGFVLTGTR